MDLVSRARNIVLTPKTEWPVVAAEPTDPTQLYTGYIAILAAIPLATGLIAQLVGGWPVGRVISIALIGYLLSLVNVAVVALAASKLARSFGGVENTVQGFKLAAYSATAFWLGGVFLLLPWIGSILRLVCGLYSLYLLWLGIPDLMLVPAPRQPAYFVVVIIAAIIVTWIIAFILLSVAGLPLLLSH